MEQQVRIDKFLWSIRVYKTRTEAADACRSGKVSVNGAEAKASRDIKAGDTVSVRKGSVHFQYRVIVPIGNRVGAKLVPEFAEDITRKNWTSSMLLSRPSTSAATAVPAVLPRRSAATWTG